METLKKGERVYCLKDRESFSLRIKKCDLSLKSEEQKKLLDFLNLHYTDYLEFIKGKIYIVKSLPYVFNDEKYGIRGEERLEHFDIERFKEYFIREKDFCKKKLEDLSDVNFSDFLKNIKK